MAQVRLLGDAHEGLKYVSHAMSMLNNMKQSGLESGTKDVVIADGVTVRIVLDPEAGDKVFIEGGCPVVKVSGFLDTYRALSTGPTVAVQDDQLIKESRLEPTPISPKMYGVRSVLAPDPLLATSGLPVEPQGTALPDQSKNQWREVFERFTPTKFTGVMRKVMQCAMATGKWRKVSDVTVGYRYGNCFGVIRNGGKYWLIRITAASVDYIPAEFCVATKYVGDAKATPPTGDKYEIPQLLTMNLAGAVQLLALNLGTDRPWSDEIGWSFSYSATAPEAATVLINKRTEPGFEGHPGVYHYPYKVSLSFSFDAVTGVPIAAAVTTTTPKLFWTSNPTLAAYETDWPTHPDQGTLAKGLLLVPKATSQGVTLGSVHFGRPLITNGPWRGRMAEYMPPSDYFINDIPIHVFFTEKKGAQFLTASVANAPFGIMAGSPEAIAGVSVPAPAVAPFVLTPAPYIGSLQFTGSVDLVEYRLNGERVTPFQYQEWNFTGDTVYFTPAEISAAGLSSWAQPKSYTDNIVAGRIITSYVTIPCDDKEAFLLTAERWSTESSIAHFSSPAPGVWPVMVDKTVSAAYPLAISMALYSAGHGDSVGVGDTGRTLPIELGPAGFEVTARPASSTLPYNLYRVISTTSSYVIGGGSFREGHQYSGRMFAFKASVPSFGAGYSKSVGGDTSPVVRPYWYHHTSAPEKVLLTDTPTTPQVKVTMDNVEYTVQNQLYGWIGVV